MKIKFLPFCVLAVTLVVSCSDDNDNVTPENPDDGLDTPAYTATLDIAGARSLALAPKNSSGRTGQDLLYGALYKVDADGNVSGVTYLNNNGEPVDPSTSNTIIDVQYILPINDDYLALTGIFTIQDTSGQDKTHYGLLVRKSDGAIFDFNDQLVYVWGNRPGAQVMKTDNLGNAYYLRGTSPLVINKLSFSDPENLTLSNYLYEGQGADYFEVDAQGNCLYFVAQSSPEWRLRKASGGMVVMEIPGRTISSAPWRGADGAFYIASYNDAVTAIDKVTVVGGEVVIETVWTASKRPGVEDIISNSNHHLVYKEHSVLMLGSTGHYEFFEDSYELVAIDFPDVDEESIIVQSENYYYVATGTNLYRVNTDSYEYTNQLPQSLYEVYSMTTGANNVVQFSVLRYSDGKIVVAEIDAQGVLTILDETLNQKITTLERLH